MTERIKIYSDHAYCSPKRLKTILPDTEKTINIKHPTNTRGRQSFLLWNCDKNLSPQSLEQKDNRSSIQRKKKMKDKALRKHKQKIQAKEEDSETSESEDFICSKQKRRKLYDFFDKEAEFQLKEEIQRYVLEEEKTEMESDLQLHYEDELNNEIEKILIDIYNYHVLSSKSKRKMDFTKYLKHITLFSRTLNEQSNIFILQILSEKIKDLIQRYKEKIFELPDVKEMREKFLKKKKSIEEQKNLFNITDQMINQHVEEHSPLPPKKHNEVHTLSYSNDSLSSNRACEKENEKNVLTNKSVTRILLLELRNIKRSLISSSVDITKVFKYPLSHLSYKGVSMHFSIEDMHREEFTKTILEDEFIRTLIGQIKNISQKLKIKEISHLLCQIEEEGHSNKREMSRFTQFLDRRLKFFFEVEARKYQNSIIELEDRKNLESSSPTNSNVNEFEILEKTIEKKLGSPLSSNSKEINCNITQTSTNTPTPTSASTTFSLAKKEKMLIPSVDIDDLIKYIASDDGKPKKSKKKNRAGKKKNEENEIEIHIERVSSEYQSGPVGIITEKDNEVEQFKKILAEESLKAYEVKKIKPRITQEWLKQIALWQ